MIVDIMQDEIDQGEPCNCVTCPVGLALSRMGYDVEVHAECVWFLKEGRHSECIELPTAVHAWIDAFDRLDDVSPIKFKLNYDG